MKSLLTFYLVIIFTGLGQTQNKHDECSNSFFINNARDWCSDTLQFNNQATSPSSNSYSACYDDIGNDIWLSFDGVASDVIIIITPESGHTVSASLYDGECNNLLEILCQEQIAGDNYLWMYKGGMIQGHKYLLRIESKDPDPFAFTVCLNNYFSPAKAGSDCSNANLLCSKEGFVVNSVIGFGTQEELSAISCFVNTTESNSIWFKWKCESSGDLTFELNPLNKLDDIDFVVFKVNGDEQSCDLSPIRCMATGVIPSQCNSSGHCCGKTGLKAGETDLEEAAGCSPTRNNFLRPLDMVAGETYALIINNYTSMNEAFEISFGGTATFQGLEADFDLSHLSGVCREDSIFITDKTFNGIGNIVEMSWSFTPDGNPNTDIGPGNKAITFSRSGTKSISVIVENESGCRAYYNDTLNVQCCGGVLVADIGQDTILEPGESIVLDVSYLLEGSDIQYIWTPTSLFNCDTCSIGATLPLHNDGIIKVNIRDEKGCEAQDQILIRVVDNNYYIPNIFSPNLDGINDIFTVYSDKGAGMVNFLKIYDRWGELIFESRSFEPNNESKGWNGTFNGKVLNPGVYVYMTEVQSKNKIKKLLKGSITLIR